MEMPAVYRLSLDYSLVFGSSTGSGVIVPREQALEILSGFNCERSKRFAMLIESCEPARKVKVKQNSLGDAGKRRKR